MARTPLPPRLNLPASGIWEVLYWNGKRTVPFSLKTRIQAEAETGLKDWLAARDEIVEEIGGITVGQIIDVYQKEHVKDVADEERQTYALKSLREFFGDLRPAQVLPATVERYCAQRFAIRTGKPIAKGTLRRELNTLTAAFNYMSKAHRAQFSKADVPWVPLPGKPDPKDRWLDVAEINHLLEFAKTRRMPGVTAQGRMSRVERFIWLALETAARRASIEKLSWTQVDFKRGLIDYKTPGKRRTKKRQAVVPISDRLMPVLKQMYAERNNDLWVMDKPGKVLDAFTSCAKDAGFTGRKHITPHTLRHTCATHMAQNGISLEEIAQVLGNTLRVVEEVYAHWQPERLKRAVNYER